MKFRRSATQFAVRQAITVSSLLSAERQRWAVRNLAAVAGAVPMLRARVQENMRLALGDSVSPEASRLYFHRVAWWLSNSLAVYHSGIAATSVLEDTNFDGSMQLVTDAMAEGHGAVLATPHWCGHELAAAVISRKHPMALVVRRAQTTEQMTRKLNWYSALGVEIVLRPNHASAIKDAAAYLKILKQGKILAITPDLLTGREYGAEVELFGRRATVFGGAFAIASMARVPLLRVFPKWQADSRVLIGWTRTDLPDHMDDRDAVIRAAAQDWCSWFEEKLRGNPQDWLLWLDKRWSRFLRETPRLLRAA